MNKWIQKAGIKKGALHQQLGISIEKDIPKTLLEKLALSKPGATVKNPTTFGHKHIHVTPLLEKRVHLALNLNKVKRR